MKEEPKSESVTDGGQTMERERDTAFVRGYVCAVANLIMLHDQPTMAKDVLRPMTPINWKLIDEYDRNVLAKAGLAPRIRRKRDDAEKGSQLRGTERRRQ
jgi:hypothetical protein